MGSRLLEASQRILSYDMHLRLLNIFFLLNISCDNQLKIINHPAYSIGRVDNYTPPRSAHIGFSYSVKGSILGNGYMNGYNGWNVPSGGVHIWDEFMVQYDSLDPPTARMLFSYPVKDSADYNKCVLLFKTNPPAYPSP